MAKPVDRETAKEVIAEVLGIQSDIAAGQKLNDDDDFYLLGGDSLLAVQVVEQLESLGFMADMNIFYQTGQIGQILDSLVPTKGADEGSNTPNRASLNSSNSTELENDSLYFPIKICEWKKTNGEPSQQEIEQLVVDIFAKKDILYEVLGMEICDLEAIVGNFFRPNCRPIVLLAYIPTRFTKQTVRTEDFKLVGAMLCCPSEDMENLPKQREKVELLQRYLNSSHPTDNGTESADKANNRILYVGMIGVLSDQVREDAGFVEYDEARWKRMILEVLLQMERRIIEMAKTKGFTMLDRVNTTEITMKMSLDLGYRMVGKGNLKAFAASEHIALDPKYQTHQCYYMVKELNNR